MAAMLHIRYEGQSADLGLAEVDLGDMSTDIEVREAAARYFNVPVTKFAAFQVDRNPQTGDVTLRPQAIFG
jgi:hypothetical protein